MSKASICSMNFSPHMPQLKKSRSQRKEQMEKLKKKLTRYGILLGVMVWATQGALAQNGNWEKISDDDGIEVFKKEVSGSSLIALKGQGVIASPIGKVAQILLDTSRARDWVDRLEE